MIKGGVLFEPLSILYNSVRKSRFSWRSGSGSQVDGLTCISLHLVLSPQVSLQP